MKDRRTQVAVLATVAVAVAIAWVGLGWGGDEAPADTAVAAHIRDRGEAATTDWGPATSLVDLLPTTVYRNLGDGDEYSLTEAYVIGEVTEAAVGRYFYSQDDDESLPESTEVESSDRRAAWATVHLTVRPDYWSSPGSPTVPDDVIIGLAVASDDVDKFANELRGFGTIAVPLHHSPVFSYDEQVFSAYFDGSFLATVGDEGQLGFPFFSNDPESRQRIDLTGISTESVVAAGDQPRIVDVVQSGPFSVRTDDAETLEILGIDLDSIVPAAGG